MLVYSLILRIRESFSHRKRDLTKYVLFFRRSEHEQTVAGTGSSQQGSQEITV